MGQTNFEAIGLKQFGKAPVTLFTEVLNATTTFDPASLIDGAGVVSTDIPVPGAALGDYVMVAAPINLQGIIASGFVSAADTVKISLFNKSGATVDLASGTWKIKVLKG